MYATPVPAGDRCWCCTQAHAARPHLREARAHTVVRVVRVQVTAAVANTDRLELVIFDLDCTGHELAAQVRARWCRTAGSTGALAAVHARLALVRYTPVVAFASAFPTIQDKAASVRDHAAR